VQYFVVTLQKYPEIALFLTIGVGFWVGNRKLGKFNLGVVTRAVQRSLLNVIENIDLRPPRAAA